MSIPPLSPRQGPLKAQSGSAGSSQPSDKPVQGRASVDTVTSQRDSQAAASSRQGVRDDQTVSVQRDQRDARTAPRASREERFFWMTGQFHLEDPRAVRRVRALENFEQHTMTEDELLAYEDRLITENAVLELNNRRIEAEIADHALKRKVLEERARELAAVEPQIVAVRKADSDLGIVKRIFAGVCIVAIGLIGFFIFRS